MGSYKTSQGLLRLKALKSLIEPFEVKAIKGLIKSFEATSGFVMSYKALCTFI